MNSFPRPIVVVSKCLGFDSCRYNGQIVNDRFIHLLKPFVEFITVCPEVEIGLGVPRSPIRIALRDDKKVLYQPATERLVTDQMVAFTDQFLTSLADVDGFILKNRSPSCGSGDVKIYQGFEKTAGSTRGSGFFGGEVLERFSGLAIEDEGRLKNFAIREHFLIKLFTLARLRKVRNEKTMKALVQFHSRHKLLFLAYHQAGYRQAGKTVANHEKLPIENVLERYEEQVKLILTKMPNYKSMINSLQHAFGGISDGLTKEEKIFFLNTIEEYRDERIPLSTVLHLLKGYALRFNNTYLLEQVFLQPYPVELMEITDSGKGRSY
jgi:uncharacterized protein YbgA (DUF1722 family)/uncharacterized protein YbbK (DUF523 family)